MINILKSLLRRFSSGIEEVCYEINWLFVSVKKRIRLGKASKIERTNNKLFIIGNGPSASSIDYTHYKNDGYEFLCVNYFAANKEIFEEIKPRYYCLIDPAFYRLPRSKQAGELFDILNNVDWKMTIIKTVGQSVEITNSNIDIINLNLSLTKSEKTKRWAKRFAANKATCGYQNVIAAALFFAICSRSPSVLITGVETDMHRELSVDINNDVYRNYVHFYDSVSMNITEKGQIGKGELYKYFYFCYKTLYHYYVMSIFARMYNVPITNLCTNSFIDVFPKKKPVNICNDVK